MILGQLGRREEAQPVIEAALKLKPDVRERLWDMARIWNMPDAHIEHIADGLRKAGLAIGLRHGPRDQAPRTAIFRPSRRPTPSRPEDALPPGVRFSGPDPL